MNFLLQQCLAVLVAIVGAAVISPLLSAQSTLIALPTRRDMVFDHTGNYLYISTSDGLVRRYNIAAGQLDAAYAIGSSLYGMDIAPDDSFLLVAENQTDGSRGVIHRLALSSGSITQITYPRVGNETGAWDVAIGSNNTALLTTQSSSYPGTVPLRQIDLLTNAITIRTDPPGAGSGGKVSSYSAVVRNPSGTRMYLLEDYYSEGSFTYDAMADTFGRSAHRDSGLPTDAVGAVNRTGMIIATSRGYGMSLDTAPEFTYLRSVGGFPSGVVFDALQDRLYKVSGSTPSQIIALDSTSGAELYRLDVGEYASYYSQFGVGVFVASNDGRFLALSTRSGIRLFTLPAGPFPPPPGPLLGYVTRMVFDHAGQYLYAASNGYIWPYHLATQTFGTPYDLKGEGGALDIAPDDSFLLTTGGYGLAGGRFVEINLATGAMQNIDYPRVSGEGGPGEVAIGANGVALGITYETSQDLSTPTLRDINLSTNTVTIRTDAPTYYAPGRIDGGLLQRSADASRIYLVNIDRQFIYEAASNSFGPFATSDLFFNLFPEIAMNRDGSRVATHAFDLLNNGFRIHLQTAPNFTLLQSFSTPSSGIAFDAVNDTFYVLSSYLSQIVAYDATTFAERFRFDTGERVNPSDRGSLVASHDGHYFAVRTLTGFHVYRVPAGVQLVSAAWMNPTAGNEFSIDIPLDGPASVESRSGGPNRGYTMIFTFGQNLTSVGGAAVAGGNGSVSSSMIDSKDPRRYIVNLSGVTDQQYVKVTLNNVVDAVGNQTDFISEQIGILIGDTNGNRTVDSADELQTRSHSGEVVTAANFRTDTNASAFINATDIAQVKANAGHTLP